MSPTTGIPVNSSSNLENEVIDEVVEMPIPTALSTADHVDQFLREGRVVNDISADLDICWDVAVVIYDDVIRELEDCRVSEHDSDKWTVSDVPQDTIARILIAIGSPELNSSVFVTNEMIKEVNSVIHGIVPDALEKTGHSRGLFRQNRHVHCSFNEQVRNVLSIVESARAVPIKAWVSETA